MAVGQKWEEFCRLYVEDKTRNAANAYIKAGYKVKDANVAAVCASKLLKNAKVEAYIAKLEAKAIKKHEITAEKVVGEIAKSAFLNPKVLFDENGALKPLEELPDEITAAIASLEVVENKVDGEVVGYTKKVRFVDKNKSLEMLGRYLALFTDKQEVKISKSLSDIIKEVDEEEC